MTVDSRRMFVPTPENFAAIKSCVEAVRDSQKPVLFWIGAGASAWCGLPLWSQLAEQMYRRFQSQLEQRQRTVAQNALDAQQFPAFFSLCRAQNPQLYFRIVIDELRPPAQFPPVYARFTKAICATKPTQIVTTNVDQCLEQGADLPSVLYRDIEQVMGDHHSEGYILKLHGSTSSSESLIFTNEDYERL